MYYQEVHLKMRRSPVLTYKTISVQSLKTFNIDPFSELEEPNELNIIFRLKTTSCLVCNKGIRLSLEEIQKYKDINDSIKERSFVLLDKKINKDTPTNGCT